jgi:hypothetical protein
MFKYFSRIFHCFYDRKQSEEGQNILEIEQSFK